MNYPSIRIEGAILSPDILERLEDAPGQQVADFGFDRNARVKDEIARAWADAQDYWRIFQRKLETLRPDSVATTETSEHYSRDPDKGAEPLRLQWGRTAASCASLLTALSGTRSPMMCGSSSIAG